MEAEKTGVNEEKSKAPVLVTGASGYVGGRLVPRLLEAGYSVRAMARTPAKLQSRSWADHPRVEIVEGDLFDRTSLDHACSGCFAAYYLVHSMNPSVKDFASTDAEAARNMATAAEGAGLERIVYLGGLGEEGEDLSHHLQSRREVARLLGSGKVPVTVLRAAMIIGSGSASFEILRYLVDRLPVMVTPRWVDTPCQPIGIRNVLGYLVGCLDKPETVGQTFDIGQKDVVTYRQLMQIYAEEAGLRRRLVIPVPVLTPRLSSYWIHLVTPVPAALARPLAEGLCNTVVCRETRIRELVPQTLLDCRMTIRLALDRIRQQQVESRWTDAGALVEWDTAEDPPWAGGKVFDDHRRVVLSGTAEQIWPSIVAIGGRKGWYYANWLWQLRGFLDRIFGGVGLDRGRRHDRELQTGDVLDFWRVVAVKVPDSLLLVAEMKLPGQATLELTLRENEDRTVELRQRARFWPRGLAGLLYWGAVYPFHHFVFNGMLRGIGRASGRAIVKGPEKIGR